MPLKLNLVINRGQYNQPQRPSVNINNGFPRNSAAPPPQVPQGVSIRRAINTPHQTGCSSCGG